ncbi:MAG TPA: alpha/beta fold hydrolase [Lentimicrobium sp.]|nr:alpha/beta fold hydrolase [Lentimicrobium sp.]
MSKATIIMTLLACWFSIDSVVYAQKANLPPLIDRELLFGNPEIAGGRLSPDGKYLSFVKPYKGTMNIWVKGIKEPFDAAKPLTADTTRPIRQYFWSKDSKYILYAQDKEGDENFNLYAVDPSAPAGKNGIPENKDLTKLQGVRVYIYDVARTNPNIVFIGLNDRDKAWHDLYKLNIVTGERTLMLKNTENDRLTGYFFDWDDNLRLATRSNQDGSNDILRIDGDKITSIYTSTVFETAYPVVFNKDNTKFYMTTNKGDRDLIELVLFDPKTQKEQFLEKDPENRVDLGDVKISELTRDIIYTEYTDEYETFIWKDKSYEKDYNYIKSQLPNKNIYFTNSTEDEQYWMVSAMSDTDPGSTYIFDRKNQKLTFQYRPRPNIPVDDLASVKPVKYPSSDGLMIPAYLTLPKGIEAKNLPLVVFPHGGPWSRDYWSYNPYIQFLANRGYAVLSPNFRGSTGYGKKYINAGNNEWGKKMQDDITWGIKYLVAEGIADPSKIGIMGGSYGGYATLAGLAFTPDVYACGVSIVGPSNLITLLNSIPPYWEAIKAEFHYRMGNPETQEGKAMLEKASPLNSASKIKSPLLVIQGANDPRVKIHESDQIVVALRERGAPVEYIVAPDEGHGFANPVNNMAMLAASEKFLSKYLGGRYQESMTQDVEKRLKDITMDIKNVKLISQTQIEN